MPTPTPAKPRSSRAVPLVVAALSALAVAHVLSSEPNEHENERDQSTAQAPTPPWPKTPAAAASDPEAVARLAQEDPDQAARLVAGALPHDTRQAQSLAVLEIRALVQQGKLGSARARASDYFERWPDGPDTAALEQLTGAHPRR